MLQGIEVRRVQRGEEARYQQLMQAHHYLGALPKIGETLWYVACWGQEWVALLSFSAAALKCGVRDRWRKATDFLSVEVCTSCSLLTSSLDAYTSLA